MGKPYLSFLIIILPLLFSPETVIFTCAKIGVNYGRLGNNLPSPVEAVELIKSIGAKMVKMYDVNSDVLNALSGTDLQVSVMVPNQLVEEFSSDQNAAREWVERTIVPYYNNTRIRYLLVANEFTSVSPSNTWPMLVPAMRNVLKGVQTYHLKKIKVGTTLAMDVMASSYPPSSGEFREDLMEPVIKPLLQFVNKSKSFIFIDAYTFFPYSSQAAEHTIDLDYALLNSETVVVRDTQTHLGYTNLLDAMLDSVYHAMERVGYSDVRICLAETGWPTDGDPGEYGAGIRNAAIYNRNLVKKMLDPLKVGTPFRPKVRTPTFIFALFNENEKQGRKTERNWGLFEPSKTPVYALDLTGNRTSYPPLPAPAPKNRTWCVMSPAARANQTAVEVPINWACNQTGMDCSPARQGNNCSKPIERRVAYVFSSYWVKYVGNYGTCFFNGLAMASSNDPGDRTCSVPYVMM